MSMTMERVAVSQCGTLRSVYDACRDTIGGKLTGKSKAESLIYNEPPECSLIKGRTAESQNLLKMANFELDLRLSIYLKMISANGIASLIDYPRRIDQNTRIVKFSYRTQMESYDEHAQELNMESISYTEATHVITGIEWGLSIIIMLQLKPEAVLKIDHILERMVVSIRHDDSIINMDQYKDQFRDCIVSMIVYSNANELTKVTNIADIYKKICASKKLRNEDQRLKYILRPIKSLCSQYTGYNFSNKQSNSNTLEPLEFYLLRRHNETKLLNTRLTDLLSSSLQENLTNVLKQAHEDLLKINELHEKQLEDFRILMIKMRQGSSQQNMVNKLNQIQSENEFDKLIQKLNHKLETCERTYKLIRKLQENNIQYCNAVNLSIKQGYSEYLIKDILRTNYSQTSIICSNEGLLCNEKDESCSTYSKMIEQRKKHPQLAYVYADFTYSTYKLETTLFYTAEDLLENPKESKSKTTNNKTNKNSASPSAGTKSSTDEFINILLIGESGVGKSTFINAFANYLRFESLDEAEQGKPTVIIPVSFMMTINDNFDEKIIRFGNIDPNENHNNQGQSVTQKCKSYVFNITSDRKLRIIDSPGFGDTRGSDQDNFNMEEIFSFLHNLTYLNGICLLFKPEVVKLNPYLRSCFKQLFDFFGENVRNSLIFCFTNTRSTFFAPGNTRPLLKKFFEEFPVKEIPFEKRNTFCFDSESFRYLVAVQDSFKFDSTERDEIEQSWTRSVTESNRFRDFLCRQHPFRQNNEWQSTKDAQFQVQLMVRPILETLRTKFRNFILLDSNSSIKLKPNPVEGVATICCAYNCHPTNYGNIWIMLDHIHYAPNSCTTHEQKLIQYVIDYEFVDGRVDDSVKDFPSQFDEFCKSCAKLSYFLSQTSLTLQDDLFLNYTNKMIDEETLICRTQVKNDLNQRLLKYIEIFKTKYQEHSKTMNSNQNMFKLSDIYGSIKSMSDIPLIQTQINAIKKYQETFIENNQSVIVMNKTSA